MRIVGEVMVDRRLFRDMLRAQMRGMVRGLRLGGGLVAALVALLWLLRPGDVLTVALTAAVPLCLFLPEIVVYLSWRRFAPLAAEPAIYELTEASVSVHNSMLRQQFDWDSFVAVEDTPDMWVLRHRVSSVVLTVVKAAFSPADQAEVDRLLAAQGLVPA